MKVNHTWRRGAAGQSQKGPKYVPIEQCRAAVELSAHNATGFTLQMVQEQMLLTLHEEFGFGRERCERALTALRARLAEWQNAVTQEFDAETFRMSYRQRETHRVELAWVWQKHDEALRELMDPEDWKPYTERYKSFGGTGAWCDG